MASAFLHLLSPCSVVLKAQSSNNNLSAGYMIANALMRLHGKTAASAVKVFAELRPPGIYKRHYIEELFKYNHERM